MLFLPCATVAIPVCGQETEPDSYEEILVYMRVHGVGGFDINAYFNYDNDRLYLPVADLFSFLKINYRVTDHQTSISGYFLDESRIYEIDHTTLTIKLDERVIPLTADDIIRTETGLYMFTGVFGRAFGLFCTFNFRAMSVELKTDLELPAIRDMRLQMMRRNLEQLRGEIEVDTTLPREHHLFRFGMVDWAFSSTQISNKTTDNRLSFATGMELLGGETNLFFNYSSRDGFHLRNQQYYWRWVSEENKSLRQIRAGKIGAGSIASIFEPMHGISVSNASTRYRRSFGSYTMNDYTEPGWTVELYINNVLVAYQVADASGYYSFDVPLVYGSSQVMLKFYGPYGEERIKEQFINIPFNFLPKGEIEYTITGGLVQDTSNSRFARASANFGISRFLTAGGGIEYLSALEKHPNIPFVSASVAPLRNLLITGEYAYGVRSKALLNYRLPSNLMVELDYTTYEDEQEAIRFNYLEERRVTMNIPFTANWLRGTARLTYKQNVYEFLTYNTANATFSTNFGPVNMNISGFASWVNITEKWKPYIYSNFALGVRLRKAIMLRPQLQYDFSGGEVVSFKAEAEKRIKRAAVFSMSYQNNFQADYQSVEVAFRWDLPFAQSNVSARLSNYDLTTTQGARGSFAFGGGNGFIHATNRSSISRGGITITPFLDINHNGIRDEDEPLASGLNVKINGGRMMQRSQDSLIRVVELEPYTGYLIELDDAGLDNISWSLPFKVISVTVDPNQFKNVNIPIQPGGEISGTVYLISDNRLRGIGRVLINIHRSDGTFVKSVMSESDGYFFYLGLAPGEYYAQIDPGQLRRISMSAGPEIIQFSIMPVEYGDIVDDLEFFVRSKEK